MTVDRQRVEGGVDLRADADVILGHPSDRMPEARPLGLGRRARLRSGTVLYAGSTIGDDLSTGHHVVVREECQLGDRVSIWSGSYVDYGVVIGHDVKIHVGCYLGQFSDLEDGVFLAPGVIFTNDLYPGDEVSASLMTGPHIRAGAQIGAGVTLLPFVEVGAGSLIGAGSVVTHDIPAGVVAFGSPARVAGPIEELSDPDRRLRAMFESRRRSVGPHR